MGALLSADFISMELTALAQVVFIDIVLAGDNAIVVGMAAAGVDARIRRKVIFLGITGAVLLRIAFAVAATQLLQIVGLTLAGGILLLWVCWKMFREIRASHEEVASAVSATEMAMASDVCDVSPVRQGKTFGQAIVQIIVADLSMSLDNVLAVAGAAREHPWVLVFGLALSIALMGLAASFIANLLQKHRWIAYVGLAVILYVALEMIYRGTNEVLPHVSALVSA
jgi:YjbE family integral membrane protein